MFCSGLMRKGCDDNTVWDPRAVTTVLMWENVEQRARQQRLKAAFDRGDMASRRATCHHVRRCRSEPSDSMVQLPAFGLKSVRYSVR